MMCSNPSWCAISSIVYSRLGKGIREGGVGESIIAAAAAAAAAAGGGGGSLETLLSFISSGC